MKTKTPTGSILAAALLSMTAWACGDSTPSLLCGVGTTEASGECVADNTVQCGEGTYAVLGVCTPFDPNDTQAPTTTLEGATVTREALISVRLVTEPGSLIFFTTDGSKPSLRSQSEAENALLVDLNVGQSPLTLRFFAMDEVGNQEDAQSVTLTRDTAGPASVTNLVATPETDGSVTLTWTNPTDADFDGVVVMREGKQVALVPGTATTATDVVYVGDAATLSDTATDGYYHYFVVSYDKYLNYGGAAALAYDNPAVLAGSTGWSFLSDGTFTAGSSPSGVTFDVSFITGNTFKISATNNTHTTYQAPKILFKNLVDATTAGNLTVGGDTFVRLGSFGESFVPGATLSSTVSLNFTGLLAAGLQTATADISFRGDGLLLIGDRDRRVLLDVIDEGTLDSITTMGTDGHHPTTRGGSKKEGIVGVVGRRGSRFVWGGSRNQGLVRKIDTSTWTTVSTAAIGADHNFTGRPFWGPNGRLWAALSTDGPGRRRSGSRFFNSGDKDCFLVSLDPVSMVETRRIRLGTQCRLRVAQMIPGTTKAAVVDQGGNRFFMVDLAFGAADPVQVLESSLITSSRTLAISPDGSKAYLAADNRGTSGDVTIIDLATQGVSSISTGGFSKVVSSGFASDGQLWLVDDSSNLYIVDPSTNIVTSGSLVSGVRAALLTNGNAYVATFSNIHVLDATQDPVRSPGSLGNRYPRSHAIDFVP